MKLWTRTNARALFLKDLAHTYGPQRIELEPRVLVKRGNTRIADEHQLSQYGEQHDAEYNSDQEQKIPTPRSAMQSPADLMIPHTKTGPLDVSRLLTPPVTIPVTVMNAH